jgi:hypothetical protein
MAHAAKVDVSFYSLSMRTFSTQAVVVQPETIVKLIEQPGRRDAEGSAGAVLM